MAYNDHDHGEFIAAPTIKIISLRLLFVISATEHLPLRVHVVAKAIVASKTSLRRPIYMIPPAEVKPEKRTLIKVVRPVYRMPELPMHRYNTSTDYHRHTLGMSSTTLHLCLMFKKDNGLMEAIAGLQVDDTITVATSDFAKKENKKSKEFASKGKGIVGEGEIRFNSVELA